MKVDKKEKAIIDSAIKYWQQNELVSSAKAEQLSASLVLKPFNWKSVAYYSFIFALVSLVIAVISIFADKELLQLIDAIIESSYLTKTISFLVLTALFYWLDHKYASKEKLKGKYSRHVFALLASISFSIAIGLFSFVINKNENPGLLILFLSIVFLAIALYRKNEIYWLFGLLSLLVAYGAATIEFSNEHGLFLGMNIPLRFTLLAAMLLALCNLLKAKLNPFYNYTFNFLLAFSFTSLWILSMSGNFSDYNSWLEIRQYELWFYSFLLLMASVAAILLGIKREDSWLKNTGVIFVFINLYTRYFEFFWDSMHKALFFAIIAVSFWLVGKQAEKIWSRKD